MSSTGPAPGWKKKSGFGCQRFHAVAHHVAGAAGDFSQPAAIDDAARQLVSAAEEGVGRGADAQAVLLGALLEVEPFLHRQHKRFLGIDVFSRVDHLLRDGIVHSGNRQIHDDVDIFGRKQPIDSLGAQLELLRARLRRIHVDVGAGAHLDALEQRRQLEIGRGDVAAADDADPQFLGHVYIPSEMVDGCRASAVRSAR